MIPYPPQNIVLQTGNGQNYLTWNQSVGALSYSVQRSTTGLVGSFTTLATPATISYLDTTAIVGTQFWYQVAATNADGTSPYTSIGTNGLPLAITPCLPGQINLGYLRYLAQLRADKLMSEYLTVDEWNSNINQSVYELYDILVSKFGDDYFFAPAVILPLTGLTSYTLPDGSNYPVGGVPSPACYKFAGLDLNISGQSASANAGWVPIARSNWSDRDRFTVFPGQAGNAFYGYQISYRVMGNQLYVFPPNTNTTLRMWYVPVMTQLLQDADMLAFSISGWSEYVILDAAMKAMVKEESLEKWNALSALKEKQIIRIETQAANRDVGQPNTVSNTRQTMGDPGFGGGWGGFGGGGGGWGGY